jgi:hypothetical protein
MAKTRKFDVILRIEVPDYEDWTESVVRNMLEFVPFPGCQKGIIQSVVPLDLTVAAVMKDGVGEMEIREGDGIPDLMDAAGECMDNACSYDILGTVLFVGSDGKVYCITTEAYVAPFNPELLAGEVEGIFDADPDNATYMSVDGAPHTYGYAVVEGNGWTIVRTCEDPPRALVVPSDQVFREFGTRNNEVFEGFSWEHPGL